MTYFGTTLLRTTLIAFFLSAFFETAVGQLAGDTVLALSPHLKRESRHNKWWGKHYREEWATPVSFKKVLLDTLEGGVFPYAQGGGRQTKSLRLRDRHDREYVLRSLQKSFTRALPEDLRGTFIETVMNDQVSLAHPFAALAVAPLAEAAGIFHTRPRLYFVPDQPALDTFNEENSNKVYWFEQRPDENWETAPNFGNAKNIIGTEKLRERLLENAGNRIDQKLYARSRLFDMFIGDWSRHDDQWRWAEFKTTDGRKYKPVPRDRDMAFSLFDGKVLRFALPVAGLKHLQTFGPDIKDFRYYNFTARNLDLHFTNSLSGEDWIEIAGDLQKRLTDTVIHHAVATLPAEVYPISGGFIEASLKSRRDHLVKWATTYFDQLAEYPSIHGSEKDELFLIEHLNDSSTRVRVYKKTDSRLNTSPLFDRTFYSNTEEIRIYGIGGEDRFEVKGDVRKGIKVRLIGGPGNDEYVDSSSIRKLGKQVKIYDNKRNSFITGKESGLRLSSYPSIHKFSWDEVRYNKRGVYPVAFYSNADGIYAGLTFSRTQFQWRKDPFGNKQTVDLRYSINQKAPSITYKGIFTDLIGKFDLDVFANYDWIRWTNYFGYGNETLLETKDRDYYRLRSKEALVSAGLSYRTRNRHRISILPYFQTITLRKDEDRFVSQKRIDEVESFYQTRKYAGLNLEYVLQNIDDSILPQKGVAWQTNVDAFHQINDGHTAATYSSQLQLLIPLVKKLGFNFRIGGSTLSGSPDFFRMNSIGGSETLRGFQRSRFYGESTAFIQSELRWISKAKTYWYSGKVGLFVFADAGRVWTNGPENDKIHLGYGPGLIVSPFNKISVWFAYGISKEDTNFHFRIIRPF